MNHEKFSQFEVETHRIQTKRVNSRHVNFHIAFFPSKCPQAPSNSRTFLSVCQQAPLLHKHLPLLRPRLRVLLLRERERRPRKLSADAPQSRAGGASALRVSSRTWRPPPRCGRGRAKGWLWVLRRPCCLAQLCPVLCLHASLLFFLFILRCVRCVCVRGTASVRAKKIRRRRVAAWGRRATRGTIISGHATEAQAS